LKKGVIAKKFASRHSKNVNIWISEDLKNLYMGAERKSPQVSISIAEIIDISNVDNAFKNPLQTVAIAIRNRPKIFIEFESSAVRANWKTGIKSLI
jgi:hypothetical protein